MSSAAKARPDNAAAQPPAGQLSRAQGFGELAAAAAAARERAYAPYSHFQVGAALLADDGTIYIGCNVENASYGLTLCAERNAVAHAVAAGARAFAAIAIASANGASPCGACRQVLAEFNPQLAVILVDGAGNQQVYSLADLLPNAFGPAQLPGSQTDAHGE